MKISHHTDKLNLKLDHPQPCEDGPLHPQALAGIQLFNHGAYDKAYKAFENAWHVETGSSRDLYRGILQVAVMYQHVKQNNFIGAVKMFQNTMTWLLPFPEICHGVDVGDLRSNCLQVYNELSRLGPRNIANFDRTLLLPIKFSE